MKGLFTQPESERRATLAGGNLFFGVLLGANLGTINALDLSDYVMLVILLTGAISGLFVVAVSKRRKMVWTTLGIYAVVLGAIIMIPELRPDQMEQEIERIVATLAIWLVFLFMVKLTPIIEEADPSGESLAMEDPAQDKDDAPPSADATRTGPG